MMVDDERASAEEDALIGRGRELGELLGLARVSRAVTLCGGGGLGKTRLIEALAAGLAPGYPDGTFVVSLADLHQPGLAAAQVAAVLGVSEEPGVPAAETLAQALSGRRLVLALDDVGHLAAACAALWERLLASSPGLLVLAAGPAALGVSGEAAWPVPPLALPPAGISDPDEAGAFATVALFARRAAAAAPRFTVNAGNCAAVAGVCAALGGSPLAIELAAARAGTQTIDQIAAGLSAPSAPPAGQPAFAGRDGDPGGDPDRDPDRGLLAALDWSHDLLTGPEQVLLRRLSVLSGWSLEMAERVCADDKLPATHVQGLLTRLAEKALVRQDPRPKGRGQDRYRMPGAVRGYAARQLAEAGETAALRRRLRDYALSISHYAFSIGLGGVPVTERSRALVYRRYKADADNIRAALAWCLEQGDTEAGLRLSTGFGISWLMLGALAESVHWFTAFLSADQYGVPDAVRGLALVGGAHHAFADHDVEKARRWVTEGLEVTRAADSWHFVSSALNLLSRMAMHDGRPGDAVEYGKQSVERSVECADRPGEGYALGYYAAALAAAGQLPQARQSAEAGLAILLEVDTQWAAALAALGLADLCRAAGDLAAARDGYQLALKLLRPVRNDPLIPRCLTGLGRVTLDLGDLPQARGYLTEGLQLSLRAGRRAWISRSLLAFAHLAVREGRPGLAVQLAAAALGEPVPPARAQRYLDAAAGLGDAEVDRLWAAGLQLTARAAADLALAPPD
jgi:predicted ATPase